MSILVDLLTNSKGGVFCFSVFFLMNLFIYLSLAQLGLRCCAQAFSSCSERGLLFVAVAPLVAEHRL